MRQGESRAFTPRNDLDPLPARFPEPDHPGSGQPLEWTLTGLCLVLSAALLALWLPNYLRWPLFWDSEHFAQLAREWDTGVSRPYRDGFCYNWPGQIYLYWVGGKLFGWGKPWTVQVMDVVLLVSFGVWTLAWSRRCYGRILPGALALLGLLAFYMQCNFRYTAQRCWHAALFAAAAVMVPQAVAGLRGGTLSGCLLGVALLFRPDIAVWGPGALARGGRTAWGHLALWRSRGMASTITAFRLPFFNDYLVLPIILAAYLSIAPALAILAQGPQRNLSVVAILLILFLAPGLPTYSIPKLAWGTDSAVLSGRRPGVAPVFLKSVDRRTERQRKWNNYCACIRYLQKELPQDHALVNAIDPDGEFSALGMVYASKRRAGGAANALIVPTLPTAWFEQTIRAVENNPRTAVVLTARQLAPRPTALRPQSSSAGSLKSFSWSANATDPWRASARSKFGSPRMTRRPRTSRHNRGRGLSGEW